MIVRTRSHRKTSNNTQSTHDGLLWCGGFTFVETMIVVLITSISLLAISSFVVSMYRANSYANEQAYAIDYARRGVTDMVQYIREANISDTGSFPIASAGTSSMIFYSNIDTDAEIEKVRYFLDGDTFKRGVVNPTGDPLAYTDPETETIIARNVRNVANDVDIFEFYGDDGVEVTDFDEVTEMTYVKVNLIININPARAPEDFTLRSSASIRNLKTNL
jgi:Tfp pilus assembly protein PilW